MALFGCTGKPVIVETKREIGTIWTGSTPVLTGNISEIEANKSDVQLVFSGDFNPMMAMMIKGPIGKFIETLATKIPGSL